MCLIANENDVELEQRFHIFLLQKEPVWKEGREVVKYNFPGNYLWQFFGVFPHKQFSEILCAKSFYLAVPLVLHYLETDYIARNTDMT